MPSNIYDRVVHNFNEDDLYIVLCDSMPDDEIVNFVRKAGISYQGIRIKSMPQAKLISDLATEFFSNYRQAEPIIRSLNKHNIYYINKIKSMQTDETKEFLQDSFPEIHSKGETGNLMWALMSDNRKQINQLTSILKANITSNISPESKDNGGNSDEKNMQPIEETISNGIPQTEILQEEIQHLENKLRTAENDHRKKERDYKQLGKKYEGLKKRVKKLTSERRELIHDKHALEKENHLLEVKVEELENKINKHKKEIERIELLQTEIHHLERDNRKLQHEVEDLREKLVQQANSDSPKIDRMQRDLSSLREEMKFFFRNANEREEKLLHVVSEVQKNSICINRNIEKLRLNKDPHVRHVNDESTRVAVFVDVQNMFYAAKKQYNARLDYAKLLEACVGQRRLIEAISYVVQTPDVDQSNFVAMLQHKNYSVKMKDLRQRADGSAKGDWDMGMAIDMITLADKVDVIVLVSGDGDFVSLVNLLKAKGPRVEVFAFPHNTAIDLREAADEFYPIGEGLLLMPEEYNHTHEYHE